MPQDDHTSARGEPVAGLTADQPLPSREVDLNWPTPEEVRRQHCRKREPTAGEAYLRRMSAEEARWLKAMVGRVARLHRIDYDDLLQEMHLALLRSDSINEGRTGLRSYLAQMATWRAGDQMRKERRQKGQTISLDDLLSEPTEPELVKPQWDWDPPATWGLTRDEAQVVRLLCWGLDINMRDFSALAERSHAAVRKNRSRGLSKIEDLFGLTPEERAALLAYRKYGCHKAAAIRLGIDEEEFRRLALRADCKVRLVLNDEEACEAPGSDRSDCPSHAHKEGIGNAC